MASSEVEEALHYLDNALDPECQEPLVYVDDARNVLASTADNDDEITVTLDRLQWAEVALAIAKMESDEEVGEVARDRLGHTLDDLKEQVTLTSMDLLELQEDYYK